VPVELWRDLLPGRAGAARDAGAGVDAREELLDTFPLTPLATAAEGGEDTEAGDRLAPAPQAVTGLNGVLTLPRVGKSPSERRLGGVLGFLGRLDVDVEDSGSGLSASSCRCWAGERVFSWSVPLTGVVPAD
jgi:hypothetical protein